MPMKDNASDIKAPGMEPLGELAEAVQINRNGAGRSASVGNHSRQNQRLKMRRFETFSRETFTGFLSREYVCRQTNERHLFTGLYLYSPCDCLSLSMCETFTVNLKSE